MQLTTPLTSMRASLPYGMSVVLWHTTLLCFVPGLAGVATVKCAVPCSWATAAPVGCAAAAPAVTSARDAAVPTDSTSLRRLTSFVPSLVVTADSASNVRTAGVRRRSHGLCDSSRGESGSLAQGARGDTVLLRLGWTARPRLTVQGSAGTGQSEGGSPSPCWGESPQPSRSHVR